MNMRVRSDGGDMTKEDRKAEVLDFMADYGLAFSPLLLYRNMKVERGVTFTVDSIRNYLDELSEDGLVMRVDKSAMDDGKISEASKGSRPYYVITQAGERKVSSDSE